MNQQELSNLGEEVRKQGYEEKTGGSMQELVFNPQTGEFEQRRRGSAAPASGIVVTEMTKEGFAIHG